jgi:hypothetical protein
MIAGTDDYDSVYSRLDKSPAKPISFDESLDIIMEDDQDQRVMMEVVEDKKSVLSELEDSDILSLSIYSRFERPQNKACFDEGLENIMKNVMELPLDNPIPLAIHQFAGVSSWRQFIYMDECDVYRATYKDATGTTQVLTRYEQKLLQWLIGYVRESIDNHKYGSDLPSFYTKESFGHYTQNRRKMIRFYGKKDNLRRRQRERITDSSTRTPQKDLDNTQKTLAMSPDSGREERIVDFTPKKKKLLERLQKSIVDECKKSDHKRNSTRSLRTKKKKSSLHRRGSRASSD